MVVYRPIPSNNNDNNLMFRYVYTATLLYMYTLKKEDRLYNIIIINIMHRYVLCVCVCVIAGAYMYIKYIYKEYKQEQVGSLGPERICMAKLRR